MDSADRDADGELVATYVRRSAEGLPVLDGEDRGWPGVGVDDLGFDDGFHVHGRPVCRGVVQESGELGGVGDEFASGFGAFLGDARGDDNGLTGEGVAEAGDDGVVTGELFVGEVPGGFPGGFSVAFAVDDDGATVDGVEAEAEISREAHGPEVVVSADEDDGAFTELSEAGLRCGGDAERLVLTFEGSDDAGEGYDVGEGEESGLMEVEVEWLDGFGAFNGLGGVRVLAGVASRFAEADGNGGGA